MLYLGELSRSPITRVGIAPQNETYRSSQWAGVSTSPYEAALIPLGAMWPWPYVTGGNFPQAPAGRP